MKSKTCSLCKSEKNLDAFYVKVRGHLGVDSKCKSCVLLFKQKQYKKNKRSKLGMIEVTADQEVIPEAAVILFINNVRCL